MPSLSEKLKSLGVTVGTDGIEPSKKQPKFPIEEVVLNGDEINTPLGQTFVIQETYPADPGNETSL